MKITLSQKQARALNVDNPRIKLLVAAGFYLGMGENQLLDIIRRGSQSTSWVDTIETAELLGFNQDIDIIEVTQDAKPD